MIKFMAALDSKRGIADEHGVPWQGKLPKDISYYHDKIKSGTLIMGYGLYKELSKPYPGGINYVAVAGEDVQLNEGFAPVYDARQFLMEHKDEEVWNLGGALLFESTIDLADELYLTLIDKDFSCTKFFPEYEDKFELVSESEPQEQNGINFRFTVWKRKNLQ